MILFNFDPYTRMHVTGPAQARESVILLKGIIKGLTNGYGPTMMMAALYAKLIECGIYLEKEEFEQFIEVMKDEGLLSEGKITDPNSN